MQRLEVVSGFANLVDSLQDSQPSKTCEPAVLISVIKETLIFLFSFLIHFLAFQDPSVKDEDGSEHTAEMSKCPQPAAGLG